MMETYIFIFTLVINLLSKTMNLSQKRKGIKNK
jgi:hypothetical protein